MPFPLSYNISAETTGPASDPTAAGGLAAALNTTLRLEGLDVSQPDPLTLRIRKPFEVGWDRSNLDPWAYVSRGLLRIEPTSNGLTVRLTIWFTGMTLITTVLGAAAIGFGLPWAGTVVVVLVIWGGINVFGKAGMEEWLRNHTRRGNA